MLCLAVLLLNLGGAAQAAPASLSVDMERPPGDCLHPGDFCVVSFMTGPDPGVHDETFHASPTIWRASFEVTALDTPVFVGFEGGWIMVPAPIRPTIFSTVDFADGVLLDDRITFDEEGPWVFFFNMTVPYPDEDGEHLMTIPVIMPIVGPTGLEVPVASSTYTVDDWTEYLPTLTTGCWFAYTLPEEYKHYPCFDVDSTGPFRVANATLPNVVFGYRVEAVSVAVGSPNPTFALERFGSEAGGNEEPLGEVGREPGIPEEFTARREDAALPYAGRTLSSPETRQEGSAASLVPSTSEAASEPSLWLGLLALGGLSILPLLRLYRRMVQKECLTNELRTAILREVRHEPGVQPAELARRLTCSFKTVQHHLRVLQEFGHVDLERRGWSIHVFERGVHPKAEKGLYLARHPTRLRVLRAVAAQPGARCRDVARALGMGSPGVHSHLKALEKEGVLRRDGVRWHLAPEAEVAWGSVQRADAVGPVVPAG
jgi:DNA-binding transcriptional ArsR family regulator